MKKIAINKCYGGFGLSPKAIYLYLKKQGKKCFFYNQTKYKWKDNKEEYEQISLEEAQKEESIMTHTLTKDMGKTISKLDNGHYWYDSFYEKRDNKLLIETIEELGEEESSGRMAKIKIIEIPDDVEWELSEYDGIETVHEKHRSW